MTGVSLSPNKCSWFILEQETLSSLTIID